MAFTCTNCNQTIGEPGYCVHCGASNRAEELQKFYREQWDVAEELIEVLKDPQLRNECNAGIQVMFMDYLSSYIQLEIEKMDFLHTIRKVET